MTRWVVVLALAYAQTTPTVPGVIAPGTKVQPIAERLQGASGLVAAPDGTVLVAEPP